jgi:outer membrane protein assembly factor BamB
MKIIFVIFLFCTFGCSTFKKINLTKPKQAEKVFNAKWIKNLDPYYSSGNLPLTTAAPTIHDGAVFVGSLDGELLSYDIENGRKNWSSKDGSAINHAPLVEGEWVYYGTELGRFFVRNQSDGKLKYAIDLGASIESKPVFSQGRVFVHLRGHQLVCLDAETGKIVWSYRRAVPISVTFQRLARPLVIGSKIYIGFADGFLVALSLEEGAVLWETKLVENQKFVDVDLDPVFLQNSLITGSPSSTLKAVDSINGAIKVVYPFQVMANILSRGDILILGTQDGEVVFVNAAGDVLKRKQVSKKGISSLKWWKEKLIISTFGGVILALNPNDLSIGDRFYLGSFQSTVYGDLEVSGEGLAIFSNRNRLYYFE